MSKAYLILIGVLALIVLGVGGFALYKTYKPQTPYRLPSRPQPPVSQPATFTTPSGETLQGKNEIPLTITSPANGSTVTTLTVTVTGTTSPNADVSVNDQDLQADASGNFSATVTLDEADNTIVVTAADQNGKSAEQEISVVYTPAQ